MKKLLSLFVCLMLLYAIVQNAGAEEATPETFTCEDYEYILLEDGTAEITKYTGSTEILTIPETLDDHPVTALGDLAFSGCQALTGVSIPNIVTSAGANPFENCESLKSFYVSPDHPTLAVIDDVLFSKPDKRLVCFPRGKAAYDYDQLLERVDEEQRQLDRWLADSEKSPSVIQKQKDMVEKYQDMLSNASPNFSYAIPQGIRIIGDYAFSSCFGLIGIDIPDSVTTIGNQAFLACSGITEISIPNSVTSIGKKAFGGTLLTSIVIPDSVTVLEEQVFDGCSRLTDVTIPDSVTTIGEGAFIACTRLKTVTIPDSVTSIGFSAFENTGLTDITIPESVTDLGGRAFFNCRKLTSISFPNSVSVIKIWTFCWCESLTEVVLPDGVTSIQRDAFEGCGQLRSITIPESVTSIEKDAFAKCFKLTATVCRGSYAEEYCKENDLQYTYPDALDWLND